MKKRATSNVGFIRPELRRWLAVYRTIFDCLEGETTIKAAGEKYLPIPNPMDKTPVNKARYEAYKTRAVFYNVTRTTLDAMVGEVFTQDPVIKAPKLLDPLLIDATGTCVSLLQLVKQGLGTNIAYSQVGVFGDYPPTIKDDGTPATLEDHTTGRIRPTIWNYEPFNILSVRRKLIGAEEVYTQIVLFELYDAYDDGFEIKKAGMFRVLRLNPETGAYEQLLYRERDPVEIDGKTIPSPTYFTEVTTVPMLDFSGNPLDRIPFWFAGSKSNDSTPDYPGFYDIASLNLAHYRNSADYEASNFILGQPTIAISGLTEEWVKNILGNELKMGSAGNVMLPVGGKMDLVQAEANTMMDEAMKNKERQMVALGAQVIDKERVQRTAFESKLQAVQQGATLAAQTKNVSAAYTAALRWCAAMVGQASDQWQIIMNTDFDISKTTPEETTAAVSLWKDGALTWPEMRTTLRKAGIATEDDTKAKAMIEADMVAAMALTMPTNEAGDPLNTDPNADPVGTPKKVDPKAAK